MNIKEAVILLVVVAVLYFFIFKEDSDEKKENEAIKDEVKELEKLAEKATYSDAQFLVYANQCFEGMRYSYISDDYAAVVNVVKKMKSYLDVLKLIAAYGVRQENWLGVLPDGAGKTLSEQIQDDLWQSDIDSINAYLRGAKINYQF